MCRNRAARPDHCEAPLACCTAATNHLNHQLAQHAPHGSHAELACLAPASPATSSQATAGAVSRTSLNTCGQGDQHGLWARRVGTSHLVLRPTDRGTHCWSRFHAQLQPQHTQQLSLCFHAQLQPQHTTQAHPLVKVLILFRPSSGPSCCCCSVLRLLDPAACPALLPASCACRCASARCCYAARPDQRTAPAGASPPVTTNRWQSVRTSHREQTCRPQPAPCCCVTNDATVCECSPLAQVWWRSVQTNIQ